MHQCVRETWSPGWIKSLNKRRNVCMNDVDEGPLTKTALLLSIKSNVIGYLDTPHRRVEIPVLFLYFSVVTIFIMSNGMTTMS